MVALVSRQGRQLQRYTRGGHRYVVGCIPYKFRVDKPSEDAIDQALQVLVISSQKGQEILFPKGGWEKDESIEEAASREAMEEAGVQGHIEKELGKWWYQSKSHDSRKLGIMFPLSVTEELLHWPEMGSRKRRWVSVAEARGTCQQQWMRDALERLLDRFPSFPREHSVSPVRSIDEQPWREFGSARSRIGDPDRSSIEDDETQLRHVNPELWWMDSVVGHIRDDKSPLGTMLKLGASPLDRGSSSTSPLLVLLG